MWRDVGQMPVSLFTIETPLLAHFISVVKSTTGHNLPNKASTKEIAMDAQQDTQQDKKPKQLPKGVVLGPDGKPSVVGVFVC